MSTPPIPQPDIVTQMVRDPDFSRMPLAEQRKALAAHDPMFQQAGDSAIGQFVQAHQPVAPQAPPNSVLGGIGRRLSSMIPDQPRTPMDSILDAIPGLRQGLGLVAAEKQLGPQVVQQAKQATASHANEPAWRRGIPNLQDVQALTTGLSMLNPFATQSVANINQLQSEDRGREAAGQGITDAALLGAGGAVGRFGPQLGQSAQILARPAGRMAVEAVKDIPVVRGLVKGAQTFKDVPGQLRDVWGTSSAPEVAPAPAPASVDQLLQRVRDAIDKRFGKQDWEINAPKLAPTDNIVDQLTKSIQQAKKAKAK